MPFLHSTIQLYCQVSIQLHEEDSTPSSHSHPPLGAISAISEYWTQRLVLLENPKLVVLCLLGWLSYKDLLQRTDAALAKVGRKLVTVTQLL